MENSEGSQLTNMLLRDVRKQGEDVMFQVKGSLEQLLATTRSHAEKIHIMEETLSVAANGMAQLPRMEEELRQGRAHIERLKLTQSEDLVQVGEDLRKQNNEVERDRERTSELQHRQELLEADNELRQAKVQALDEVTRRFQEIINQIPQQFEDMAQENQELNAKALRNIETSKRDVIGRLDREVGPLRKQDDVVVNKIELVNAQVKHLEENCDAVFAGVDQWQKLVERMDLQHAEIQRLEKQLVEHLQLLEEIKEQLDITGRAFGHLDSRSQTNNDRLVDLQQQVWDTHRRAGQQVSDLAQIEEKQKKRQIVELEQQLRELKKHTVKPIGD